MASRISRLPARTLYAGLSNFPAWRLARAVTLAELSLSVPIAAAQFEHSLVHREPEADLALKSLATHKTDRNDARGLCHGNGSESRIAG